jgi:phosphoribosylaminoimidazolecarboxamide formyltransferase/IMP cyclohydrolase
LSSTRRAILSVSNKTSLEQFAKGLEALGWELYSTGGTQKALQQGGCGVKGISTLTGFPEMMEGRVKTLHPAVHGGILARRDNPADLKELAQHGIGLIDLVAVNLYPFVETVSRPKVSLEEALENIDVGGPTMVRAAAKNFPHVIIVVDPGDYSKVLAWLKEGGPSIEQRRELAWKAFQHTALYDTYIASYLRGQQDVFPEELTIGLRRVQALRYGENPHQKGALYQEGFGGGLVSAQQLHGKEMSYVNFLDADAAWRAATEFPEPTVVVIKHTTPCGLASHPDLTEAYRRALAGDPVSAYGGIVALNRIATLETTREISKTHYDILLAPDFEPDALKLLQRKRDLRILKVPPAGTGGAHWDYRRISGGVLVQTPDVLAEDPRSWKVVTERAPTERELEDLAFAWRACKHVKSNAITLAKDKMLVGMGAGQPNRVTSVHLALRAAGERSSGSVLASDAFFPFPDNVELATSGGVTAIAQPGGSIRDKECIEAANKAGIAMLFTGVRHFRH